MKRWICGAICFAALLQSICGSCFAGGAAPKYVAISFDDGPSGPVTEALLDGLDQRGAKATFFVCGYRVDDYPKTLERIAEAGHEIGLHSCCHQYMQGMEFSHAYADLLSCMQTVSECCGIRSRLFRPPGGSYDQTLLQAAKELDLSVILWSVDPKDWDETARKTAAAHIVKQAAPGAVILMHDLTMQSVQQALSAIDTLQSQGYVFVTISELAQVYDQTLLPGEVYRCFSLP